MNPRSIDIIHRDVERLANDAEVQARSAYDLETDTGVPSNASQWGALAGMLTSALAYMDSEWR